MRSLRISASLLGGVLKALEGEGNQAEVPSKEGRDWDRCRCRSLLDNAGVETEPLVKDVSSSLSKGTPR